MTWKISCEYRLVKEMYPLRLEYEKREIIRFLQNRGYKRSDSLDSLHDLSGNIFTLNFSSENIIFEVLVYTEKGNNQYVNRVPSILMFVSDYFIQNNWKWLYLETLDECDILRIDVNSREISPLSIFNRIAKIGKFDQIPILKVEQFGKYNDQQKDIYSGSKQIFSQIEDFWISFLNYYHKGEFEYSGELNILLLQKCFDKYYGECIPYNRLNLEFETGYLSKKMKWFDPTNILKVYKMRDGWNDKVYLFEMEDSFILYNWWTSE